MSLTKEISDELIKRGFCVWRTHENTVSCFDILARRDVQIFVIEMHLFLDYASKKSNLTSFGYFQTSLKIAPKKAVKI